MEARAKHGDEAAEALRTFASCFVLRIRSPKDGQVITMDTKPGETYSISL